MNNILSYSNVNEEYENIKNDEYIEGVLNLAIDLERDIESNYIKESVDEEKYNEDYSKVDIKSICKDTTITPIEKIYLIQLIANINVDKNCVKMSMDELVSLFNNKNRNQVTKKIHYLEKMGAIKIIHTNKGNRYYILKHIKGVKPKVNNSGESIRNDTSIISDTLKCKEIEKENADDEIIKLLIKNIKYFQKGVDWNEKYLRKVTLEKNKIE